MSVTITRIKSRKRKQVSLRGYQFRTGLLLISPWLIGFLLLKLLPILASLVISFTDFYLLEPTETQFVGLQNYLRVFNDDAIPWVLASTLRDAVTTVPLQIVASIALAALLNNPKLKGRDTLRTLFFIPSIIPSVAIIFMWFGFTDPDVGWLNRLILEPLGLEGFGGVYEQGARELLFSISSLWAIGPGMLIILGALQGLNPEIIEAARVDGAGPLLRFFSIKLPLISPAIFFSIIINLIALFGGVILMDRGNSFSGGTSAFDRYINNAMFNDFQFGYAASLAWFLFIIVFIVTLLLFASSRKWVFFPDSEEN